MPQSDTALTQDLLTREQVRQHVDAHLQELYECYRQDTANIDGSYDELLEQMATFIARGGKRLRPYLTYLGYRGVGGEDNQAILGVATSQELLHNFLLIHDDVIDRDQSRYHGRNLSGVYGDYFQSMHTRNDADHYGQSVAILAGDINHILVYQLLSESDFDATTKLQAIAWVGKKTLEVAGGELLDLMVATNNLQSPSKEQLYNIAQYKTASYSFECPLVLGALCGGADDGVQKELLHFARPLGVAYQLQDDMLGMFGDSETTGKPVISDLREGKHTLLMYYGFRWADDKQRTVLEASFANPDVTAADLQQVRDILDTSGAKTAVEKHIEQLAAEARENLGSNLDTSVRTVLDSLVDKVLQRAS